MKKFDKAIENYNDALKVYPKNYLLWYNKGVTSKNQENYDEAVACFKTSMTLNPFYKNTHIQLGDIFFKQKRHGKDNNFFLCWKFRTMTFDKRAEFKQATKNDNRITKIGAILRKTSIDEIPQFINVFLGDMSVVGPRPHPIKLNEEFQPKIDRFWQRHAVIPGITGLAQAKGFRGETVELSDMSGRVKLDRFYVKNWSLILDLKIILLTALSIIKGDQNAY